MGFRVYTRFPSLPSRAAGLKKGRNDHVDLLFLDRYGGLDLPEYRGRHDAGGEPRGINAR